GRPRPGGEGRRARARAPERRNLPPRRRLPLGIPQQTRPHLAAFRPGLSRGAVPVGEQWLTVTQILRLARPVGRFSQRHRHLQVRAGVATLPNDEQLCDYLSRSGVEWRPLDEPSRATIEQKWREIYGRAFVGRPRLRQGGRADHVYDQESCTRCVISP